MIHYNIKKKILSKALVNCLNIKSFDLNYHIFFFIILLIKQYDPIKIKFSGLRFENKNCMNFIC